MVVSSYIYDNNNNKNNNNNSIWYSAFQKTQVIMMCGVMLAKKLTHTLNIYWPWIRLCMLGKLIISDIKVVHLWEKMLQI